MVMVDQPIPNQAVLSTLIVAIVEEKVDMAVPITKELIMCQVAHLLQLLVAAITEMQALPILHQVMLRTSVAKVVGRLAKVDAIDHHRILLC